MDLGQGAIKRWTLVGGRGTEAVIEMYCVRKNLFQKKIKKDKLKFQGLHLHDSSLIYFI